MASYVGFGCNESITVCKGLNSTSMMADHLLRHFFLQSSIEPNTTHELPSLP